MGTNRRRTQWAGTNGGWDRRALRGAPGHSTHGGTALSFGVPGLVGAPSPLAAPTMDRSHGTESRNQQACYRWRASAYRWGTSARR